MTVNFGPFTVDEPARSLRLRGREMSLQPRVFDLLVYLLRHHDRIVTKDELLDALWPGVLVTDNSVQRAVSLLRSHLREGGLEEALRHLPRAGYRLRIDEPGAPAEEGADAGAAERARAAVAARHWSEAEAAWQAAAGAGDLDGADYDAWALTLQCRGRPAEAEPLLVRAVSAHVAARACDAAAASAVMLSTIHLERNAPALARGWLARADDLIADRPESPSRGLVLWMQARLAATEGDPERALDLAGQTYAFGRSHALLQVEALGLVYRGFYRLSLGLTAEGLADQDHAAALALSGGVDPLTGGTLYCNILWACRTFGDWARADQWTLSYQDFCSSCGMEFSGACQLHRAEVLGVRGSLAEALAHIDDAVARLSDETPWALGDAHRVRGDILAALGRREDALAAYARCDAMGWDPEPGRALLCLEQGDAAAACAGLERSLVGQGWWTLQRQGVLRAHLAIASVAAGRLPQARELVAAFEARAERWPMASLRALNEEAKAGLALASGDPGRALRSLQLARELWTSAASRLNAVRLRVAIASLLRDLGDPAGAQAEARTAVHAATELGAAPLLARARELLGPA